MFAFHDRSGRVEVAFTDRHGRSGEPLNLALPGSASAEVAPPEAGLRAVAEELGLTGPVVGLRQVNGGEVVPVDASYDGTELVADGLVTHEPELTLLVRAADCVPVLFADVAAGVIGAAHAGRPGVVARVVPHTIAAMRDLGAREIRAWVGPHVCGHCYEVPSEMRDEVAAVVPETWAETSWGTPALDIGAGVRAQLFADGVAVTEVERCTIEDDALWSHRRQGAQAGRLGGLIRMVR